MSFIFQYWKPLLSITCILAVIVFYQVKISSLQSKIETITQTYSKSIKEQQVIIEEEQNKRKLLSQEYNEALKAVSQIYEHAIEQLSKQQKIRKTEITVKLREHPEEVIKQIQETYGLHYVE